MNMTKIQKILEELELYAKELNIETQKSELNYMLIECKINEVLKLNDKLRKELKKS